jgi:SWI/SNF-related matrix-associated actin-dependent regulator of chromatin subfamily A member 5
LSLSKRERKSNYSVDNYFKDTLRAGPSKTEKAPKIPRAPKQIQMFVAIVSSLDIKTDRLTRNDFQFFPPELATYQERELAVFKVFTLQSCSHVVTYHQLQRLNGIPATLREAGPDDTPEELEAERQLAQNFIDTGESLPYKIVVSSLIFLCS